MTRPDRKLAIAPPCSLSPCPLPPSQTTTLSIFIFLIASTCRGDNVLNLFCHQQGRCGFGIDVATLDQVIIPFRFALQHLADTFRFGFILPSALYFLRMASASPAQTEGGFLSSGVTTRNVDVTSHHRSRICQPVNHYGRGCKLFCTTINRWPSGATS